MYLAEPAEEVDASAAYQPSSLTEVAHPPVPPEPAIASASGPVAEQIVDRVLRRLRPELVEEVRRLLQNPEA
jgi:hypothetical protein